MKKYLFLASVVLGLGLIINYSLGGFSKLEPALVDVNDYIIYGTDFEGSYKSNELSGLVEEMRVLQQELNGASGLVIINYINEAKETIGNVHNFVGLQIKDPVDTGLVHEYEKRIIKATKAVRLSVKIKPLIMPTPEKIKETMLEYSKKENLNLQNLSIERYNENGVLIVEFPTED